MYVLFIDRFQYTRLKTVNHINTIKEAVLLDKINHIVIFQALSQQPTYVTSINDD